MITMFIQSLATSEVIDQEILSSRLGTSPAHTASATLGICALVESPVQSKLNFKNYEK